MRIPKNHIRAIALFTMIVSVIGFILNPVSAAGVFYPSGDTASSGVAMGNTVYHHAFNSTQQAARFQAVLANLSQQGVDVSQAQADLAAGNLTAARELIMAYHKAHPDLALSGPRQHVINATAQASRVKSIITTLSQKGVDVSKALADLAAGNTTGAMKDLLASHAFHPGTISNSTQQAARLQAIVTRLAQQGVDVTEVQADLTAGNVNAAMQWMTAYHKVHPVQAATRNTLNSGNNTAWQKSGSFRPHAAGFGNQTGLHSGFRGLVKST